MQELVYCLSYILEHMDLISNWVDIEVEMVSVYVICAVRTVKVWIVFCGVAQLIQSAGALFLEHLKNILGKKCECFKSCNTAGKSYFNNNNNNKNK